MARPSKDERREQIAEALLAVMARQGYEGASVAAVARQAKVAVGLAHYHFRDKREILLQALTQLGQRQEGRVAAAVEAAGSDPRAQLDAWLSAHLGVASAAPVDLACWVMAGGEALRDPEVRRVHAGVVVASVDGLTSIVRRGIADGAFQAEKTAARAIAVALGALVQGYFTVASVAPELPPAGSALKAARAMARGLLGAEVVRGAKKERRAREKKTSAGAPSAVAPSASRRVPSAPSALRAPSAVAPRQTSAKTKTKASAKAKAKAGAGAKTETKARARKGTGR